MPVDQEPRSWDDILAPPPLHAPPLTAGVIRTSPADFEVEEVPAFEPADTGDHLFLWIRKQGQSTSEAVRWIARQTGINGRDIGTAGQKDKYAITRQWISLPAVAESRLDALNSDAVQVLAARRHTKKLRTGQLYGNRFTIVVDHPDQRFSAADQETLTQQLAAVAQCGFANYFGPQRFGHNAATLAQGLRLLDGASSGRRSQRRVQPWLRRLALSAAQSAVFNRCTARRVEQHTVTVPQPGDVVIRKGGTRPYRMEAPVRPAEMASGSHSSADDAVIPAGPLPGPSMVTASGHVAEEEEEVLAALGLSHESFARHARLCSGTRRPMLDFPETVDCGLTEDGRLRLRFTLRRGCYATVLLRELFTSIRDAAGLRQDPPEA